MGKKLSVKRRKKSFVKIVALSVVFAIVAICFAVIGFQTSQNISRGQSKAISARIGNESSINIIEQPKSQTASVEDEVVLSVRASTPTSGGTISYTWYSTDEVGSQLTPIHGGTNQTFKPDTTKEGVFFFQVRISVGASIQTGMPGGNVLSNIAKLEIKQGPAKRPVITSQPQSSKVAKNSELTISVTAEAEGTLSYQWYSNTTASTENGKALDKQTQATLDVDTSVVGEFFYFVKVINTVEQDGQTYSASINSNVATIEVGDFVVQAPEITQQPGSITIAQYDIFKTLSVMATGSGELSYQWYTNTTLSNVGGTMVQGEAGEQSSILVDASTIGQFYYYVVVTNTLEDGQAFSLSSDVGVVSVVSNLNEPKIITQPQSIIAESGQEVILFVEIEEVAPGVKTTYEWYFSGQNSYDGATYLDNSNEPDPSRLNVTREDPGTNYYFVDVTNSLDGNKWTTRSSIAIVEVKASSTNTNNANADRQGNSGIMGVLFSPKSSTVWYIVGGAIAVLSLGTLLLLPSIQAKIARRKANRYYDNY